MKITNQPQKALTRCVFLALAGTVALTACVSDTLAGSKGGDFGRPAAGKADGDEWPRSSVAEQGVAPAGINAMLEKIRAEKLPTHAFLLAHNGYLLAAALRSSMNG